MTQKPEMFYKNEVMCYHCEFYHDGTCKEWNNNDVKGCTDFLNNANNLLKFNAETGKKAYRYTNVKTVKPMNCQRCFKKEILHQIEDINNIYSKVCPKCLSEVI